MAHVAKDSVQVVKCFDGLTFSSCIDSTWWKLTGRLFLFSDRKRAQCTVMTGRQCEAWDWDASGRAHWSRHQIALPNFIASGVSPSSPDLLFVRPVCVHHVILSCLSVILFYLFILLFLGLLFKDLIMHQQSKQKYVGNRTFLLTCFFFTQESCLVQNVNEKYVCVGFCALFLWMDCSTSPKVCVRHIWSVNYGREMVHTKTTVHLLVHMLSFCEERSCSLNVKAVVWTGDTNVQREKWGSSAKFVAYVLSSYSPWLPPLAKGTKYSDGDFATPPPFFFNFSQLTIIRVGIQETTGFLVLCVMCLLQGKICFSWNENVL